MSTPAPLSARCNDSAPARQFTLVTCTLSQKIARHAGRDAAGGNGAEKRAVLSTTGDKGRR